MTTLSKAAYNILNVMTGGHSQNNERFSIEHIKYTILYYRSLLIHRDMERNRRTYELEQDLGPVALEIIDPSMGAVGGPGDNWRGLVLRTARRIPATVRLNGRSGITGVTSPDMRYTFPIIEYHQSRWLRYNQYTPNNTRAFPFRDRVYLHTNKLADELNLVLKGDKMAEDIPPEVYMETGMHVIVRGIFEDPRKAWEFRTRKEFDDDSSPFPLPKDMEQRIAQSLLKGEFQMIREFPHDTTPNMRNETETTN